MSDVDQYAAFSDESRHSEGRFRSIASVSIAANLIESVSNRVRTICDQSEVGEFKWQKLVGARERFCAVKIIDLLCLELLPLGVRVDVLVWDTQDQRHRIDARDDNANFERMFFHLHGRVMRKRSWGAEWHLRPDERFEIDWTTVQSTLRAAGRRTRDDHPLFQMEDGHFIVKTLKQVVSADAPLRQVADFFAGIAPYSRNKSVPFREWLRGRGGQQSLDHLAQQPVLSRSDIERFQVVEHLYDRCRAARLGVSLKTHGYLRSKRGDGAINFWHYEPQHSRDRAPTRLRR